MRSRGGWAAVVVVCVGSLGCHRHNRGSGPVIPVIPPGQEAVVSTMLSVPGLPSRCVLDEASIDHDHILARYQCASGASLVSLVHPTKAPPTAVRTAQFALVSANAPADMLPALATQIRTREAAFHWTTSDRTQR